MIRRTLFLIVALSALVAATTATPVSAAWPPPPGIVVDQDISRFWQVGLTSDDRLSQADVAIRNVATRQWVQTDLTTMDDSFALIPLLLRHPQAGNAAMIGWLEIDEELLPLGRYELIFYLRDEAGGRVDPKPVAVVHNPDPGLEVRIDQWPSPRARLGTVGGSVTGAVRVESTISNGSNYVNADGTVSPGPVTLVSEVINGRWAMTVDPPAGTWRVESRAYAADGSSSAPFHQTVRTTEDTPTASEAEPLLNGLNVISAGADWALVGASVLDDTRLDRLGIAVRAVEDRTWLQPDGSYGPDFNVLPSLGMSTRSIEDPIRSLLSTTTWQFNVLDQPTEVILYAVDEAGHKVLPRPVIVFDYSPDGGGCIQCAIGAAG